jgi:predicted enzyme related to lactoylglutathione lyase
MKNKTRRAAANGPLIYLSVEGRLDEAVETARKNGGKVLRARQKIGEHGFRAVIIDSEGNRIALHASA